MLNGILNVNKPQNMTSHDVVAILRRKLKTKKIGHTGTLDPMATGVLPICVGNATKIVDYLMDQRKAYRCQITFGSATNTQDQWGVITQIGSISELNEGKIRSAIMGCVGEISQVPPMYSALKLKGEKLVDLARQGIEVEREPRQRTIYKIDIIEVGRHTSTFEVECSKGTYIRTLCHDIGLALGCFAHMSALTRVLSSPFSIEQSYDVDLITLDSFESLAVSIDQALSFLPSIKLLWSEDLSRKILNGVKMDLNRFTNDNAMAGELYYRVYLDEVFYGIAERQGESIFMKKVMKSDV